MTRPRRPPRPGYKQAPEYILRVLHTSPQVAPEDALAVGYYYGGRSSDGELIWVPEACNLWSALRMRGAGLASAVRSLNRLGYIVERIPA
jgi:hypothetical protein